MLIKYYNNKELAYTNRKRYGKFSFSPFATEEQKSVLLGDGATTLIKTKKSNICNYVTIDDTRWYVTSYIYLNGGQVQLNLQRDVVGEFGIGECFGKIERGYTENFLRNRKELNLNQILKDRKHLIPSTTTYGNYSINTHEKEMWGVLYFVKPTGIDPNTGNPYEEQVTVNIPAFRPLTMDYEFKENNSKDVVDIISNCYIKFRFKFKGFNTIYEGKIDFVYNKNTNYFSSDVSCSIVGASSDDYTNGLFDFSLIVKEINGVSTGVESGEKLSLTSTEAKNLAFSVVERIKNSITTYNKDNGYSLPKDIPNIVEVPDYNGCNILISGTDNEAKIANYNVSKITTKWYGLYDKEDIMWNYFLSTFNNTIVNPNYSANVSYLLGYENYARYDHIEISSNVDVVENVYNYNILSDIEAGNISINTKETFIDEPYSILVFPLFNVSITKDDELYSINKSVAFNIFNSVIQFLSGENCYLVDAQIYPYCPELAEINTFVLDNTTGNKYPFFSIKSTCYFHNCKINLYPNIDIKKEYIQRVYSIISPEQTGKFDFNFYDYVNTVNKGENNDSLQNFSEITIRIKTALKPFSIISSACIIPEQNSLIGITYDSDLRGSQPTSNGFECSLSSNAFESYKRQNSNYQQIFALQQQELQKQHSVERVNEATSIAVNTVTATAMGAIAGANMAGGTGLGAAIAGSATALTAGAIVGTAMGIQYNQNEKLRDYEEKLQKQMFDLEIGTIKNLPNTINRISSFNEIIMRDFWYVVEIYECSEEEKIIVDNFIENYGYGIGVFDYLLNYQKDGWFLRSTLISSNYQVNLHLIAEKEFMGGIYYYEQV